MALAGKKLKGMKMPAPKSAKDPMLEMDEMDLELELPGAKVEAEGEEEPAEEMDMGEMEEEGGTLLADVSDFDLKKELEDRGFTVSYDKPEPKMEESEEEEA